MSAMSATPDFAPALPHGELQPVLPGVHMVTGTMKTVLMGAHWHFSRNMTVISSGRELTLVNTVRLDDGGLAALDALGTVTNIVRLGALHGQDDAFYKHRHPKATYWAPAGVPPAPGIEADRPLVDDGAAPLPDASVFLFRQTKLPEAILHLGREGGILVACDALQNWLAPDAFFSDESRAMMTQMGFFTPANIGPAWRQFNEPQGGDFERLMALDFRHVLPGHGSPLKDSAREAFGERFAQVFAS